MSIGPIYGYTGNYKFTLIEYDFPRWQSYEHDNWRNLDAVLGTLFGTFGLGGVWKNGMVYNVNERIIDADENVLYLCLVDNTAITTGTFGQDRALNPANWRSLSFTPANRGNWSTGTQYNVQDIVISGSQIAICKLAHLSSSSFNNDVNTGYWSVLIDVTGYNIGLSLTRNNNLSDLSDVVAARSNLGLGSAAQQSTGTFFSVNNNLSEGNKTAIAATLGLKSGAFQDTASYLVSAQNLSDLTNKGNARDNLGLGVIATQSSISVAQIQDAGATGASLLKSANPAAAAANIGIFVGDNGSGGSSGAVPAPSTGDGLARKFLRADGSWAIPTSAPNVGNSQGLTWYSDNAKVYVSWVGITLLGTDGVARGFPAGSVQINAALVGAPGGFDTAPSANTWYGIYVISDGITVQGLLSANSPTPANLPAGYKYYYRVGWVKTTAAGNQFVQLQAAGTRVIYLAPANYPLWYSGAAGDVNAPTFTPLSTLVVAPPTALSIQGMVVVTAGVSMLGEQANHTGRTGAYPASVVVETTAGTTSIPFDLARPTGVYYYASNSGSAKLIARGWSDLL